MPIEAKPLFRPDVLRRDVTAFELPEHVAELRPKLAHWAELMRSKKADSFKEQELLPDFLTDFFCELLGYTRPADGSEVYTLSREKHVQVDGKFADAVLGRFGDSVEQPVVALEGKGPKDPLERPYAGRRMSAVDQAYRYAINLPCDWIIVTSMRETRLYHKGSDQHTYERFETARLSEDDAVLKRFVFLLGAERVTPKTGRCHLYALREASDTIERELTKDFYVRYADMRRAAFDQLRLGNPDVSPSEVLRCTQKLLDRILFCAFCEDRSLLPPETIKKAFEHQDPYNPRPIWENFRGLFRSIDQGNAGLNIPAYNGGLFAADPVLDGLNVPDEVCSYCRDLGAYDYRPASEVAIDQEDETAGLMVDVDILGHIFEQSITDLERLRNELDGQIEQIDTKKTKSRRKTEGAFYTPAFITRYIIQQALGGVLSDRFETLRKRHEQEATGTARSVMADPNVYELDKLNNPQRAALIRFWAGWQEELGSVRILDPACGSGAFLIEAFDQLYTTYQASNDRLDELSGQPTLFDLDRQILQNNLYGVDLNAEAVQICQLSLWIKTAARGKILTSLDETVCEGNSVVSDRDVHPKAFNWDDAFPEVFKEGGFDVVVGNPPYVRQELLTPYKPYLQTSYESFHGMADLYVYFYELGIRVLKPGGLLSFIVTNKWMKAGYGEALRRFFSEKAWVESVVDFGHAKQIFEEADVFPSIIVARKPFDVPPPTTALLCTIPREQLRIDDLSTQIEREGVEMGLSQLSSEAWQLESKFVVNLLKKIQKRTESLSDFARVKPYRGILTGFNQVFLIDSETRNSLVATDPKCAELIKPYIRGQDVSRWEADWAELWMIVVKSSSDFSNPWSEAGDMAEEVFRNKYPSLYNHMKPFEEALKKRQDKGRYWWELRACAYWEMFDKPKIFYQEIQFHPSYAMDSEGYYGNNKTFFITSQDLYLLAVLNSPLIWWHNWRYLPHMKDEALSPAGFLMENLPIASPSDLIRNQIESLTKQLLNNTKSQKNTRSDILDWLRVEHEIDKPNKKLQAPSGLDSDAFVAEIKKLRGKKNPLSVAALRSLRDEHTRTIEPARIQASEALNLERQISDLVNEAYGLTPDEVALMWKTAPPRMPIPKPE